MRQEQLQTTQQNAQKKRQSESKTFGKIWGQSSTSLFLLVGLMILAVFSRLIPHPWNFTAVGAVALFGGTYIQSKRVSLMLPFVVLLMSDLILGFHETMIFVYGAFLLTVLLGWTLRAKKSAGLLAYNSLMASSLFFFITNAGVWWTQEMYTKDLSGLLTSYAMALPFFGNQIAGDLFFSVTLFAGYELLKRAVVSLHSSSH